MRKILLLLSLVSFPLYGVEDTSEIPLFSGTLLSFFSVNADPGRFFVEPLLFGAYRNGFYNSNSTVKKKLHDEIYSLLILLETGITKNIDITLEPLGVYSHTPRGNEVLLGDTFVYLGFQISKDKKGTWIPDIRLLVGENFPTGKYQHLDPKLEGADGTGTGTYDTWVVLALRKIFYTFPKHPYNWALNVGAIHSTSVHVEGLNVYGGITETDGTIDPRERFFIDLAFEYKFNQPWGWGFDLNYIYSNGTTFHSQVHEKHPTEGSSSYLFSFAPMLEYNFSQDLSLSGGVWFSLIGRNAFAFYSGVFSVFYGF